MVTLSHPANAHELPLHRHLLQVIMRQAKRTTVILRQLKLQKKFHASCKRKALRTGFQLHRYNRCSIKARGKALLEKSMKIKENHTKAKPVSVGLQPLHTLPVAFHDTPFLVGCLRRPF
ncbi:hypothetical protein TcCL_ESM01726 [Trypanosoma cruzi]|nr:hypothetical protein TcCL_ESM01726 [Trypanosoma cruzi]